MVILGAGASYDSIYEIFDAEKESIWRPPLANELFEPRENFRKIFEKYEGLKLLYSSINAIDDIEEFFQTSWDFAIDNNATELLNSLINVQFALQELMFNISSNYANVGLSNYDVLINEAYKYSTKTKEDVLFVTFNYDLFMEFSIRKLYPANFRYLHISDYIKHPLKLIKLHGSCNWFRKFKEGFPPDINKIPHHNELFRSNSTFQQIEDNLDKEIIVAGLPQYPDNNKTVYCFPQLLIPFKSKDSFVLPSSHREYLEECISKVNSILIIGWKGNEEVFLNLLKNNLSNNSLEIESINCGNTNIEQHMKQYLPNANFYHFQEGFQISKYNSRSNPYGGNGFYSILDGSFSAYCLRTTKKMQASFFML